MFWHAEGMKIEYQGKVVLDGIVYDIIPKRSFGYADKNWGSDFTSPWLWISSCNMQSLITGKILHNSAIEIGGGRPKVIGVALQRKLLIGMYYEDKMQDYNFSKFWTRSKASFEFSEGKKINTWNVNASNKDSIMELTLECAKDEMLLINYEAPNGQKNHKGFGMVELAMEKLNSIKNRARKKF